MKLLIIALTPLSTSLTNAPLPVQAIPDFLAAGHRVYLAAPLAGSATEVREALGIEGVLPLHPTAPAGLGRLALNAYRVGYWARFWRPEMYLAVGFRSALLANGGRGAAGGYGLSVLVVSSLHGDSNSRPGRFMERRAIQESDRLITYEATVAQEAIASYGARGGDTKVLSGEAPSTFVGLCEQFLAEPPGFN
jgi:hypothetical protein